MYGQYMSDPQIQAAIAAFAAQLETLIREKALAAVTAILGGGGAAPSKVAALTTAPKKRGRPTKAAAAAKAAASPRTVAAPKAPAAKKTSAPPKKASKSSGKRVRRSAEQIEAMAKKIATHVAAHPGQRAEQLKKAIGIKDNEWGLPIAVALESRRVSSKGQKRSTTYFPGK